MTDIAKIAGELSAKIDAGQIRGLSILQPWCHRIFHEGKDVENRDWPTKGRGLFLIHAGKSWDGGKPDGAAADAPRGGIVGFARIIDCVDKMDSPWFYGKYGFVLAASPALALICAIAKSKGC